MLSPPYSSPLPVAGCAVTGNSILAFLCSCDVLEVTSCRSEMSGHTPQSDSRGSLTWASPWLATIGHSSRTGWEIPLLEAKESGRFVVQVTCQVPFTKECLHTCPGTAHPRGKHQLLWSRQTPSPRLSGNSWQLTVEYQTWVCRIRASIFPLDKRMLRPRFLPLYSEMMCELVATLQECYNCGTLLHQCSLSQPDANIDTMCPFSSQMTSYKSHILHCHVSRHFAAQLLLP